MVSDTQNPKPATIRVEGSFLNIREAKLHWVGYSEVESVFELRDSQGKALAKVITEPPCTAAQKVALIFPSGLTTILHQTQE